MSYVSQQFLLEDASSLANFKNWAQAISIALSSSGWTQTSDTGQVNWSTIAAVPAAGSFVYEIWQPGDPLQTGSSKFYLKISYGKSTASPAGARVEFQLSTSTDGAGNLNGFSSALFDPLNNNDAGQGSIITFDCYFSGDVNRFGLMLWRSGSAAALLNGFVLVIERTKNTDGTDSTDGVHIVCVNRNNQARGFQTLVFGIGATAGAAGAPDNGGTYCVLGWDCTSASAAFNNNIPIYPAAGIYGKVSNPLTMIGWVHSQDVAEACIFTTTLYGATRTYIASAAWTNINSPTNLNTARTIMRYD